MSKLICPDCGADLVLKPSKFGHFYGCERYSATGCSGAVGCHSGTTKELGVPADKETRKLRIAAHEAFDKIWKENKMTRRDSYRWLEKEMGLDSEHAHIGMFTAEQCRQLIEKVSILTKEK